MIVPRSGKGNISVTYLAFRQQKKDFSQRRARRLFHPIDGPGVLFPGERFFLTPLIRG